MMRVLAGGLLAALAVVVLAGAYAPGVPQANPNLLINPGMEIDQANEGAAVGAPGYVVDAWNIGYSTAATGIAAQRTSDAPAGFADSLQVTIGTGSATVGAGDYFIVRQPVEANQLADTAFSAAGARALALSYWVKASVAGTYGWALRNAYSYTRTYASNCTVAANVWTQCEAVIPGDTAAGWTVTGSGAGLELDFVLEAGSSFQQTAATWLAGNGIATSAQTQLTQTTGAIFEVTGVKLEVAPAATPFARRPFAQELALCQRYYEKSYPAGTAVGTVTRVGMGYANGFSGGTVTFAVTKRTTPSFTFYSTDTGTSGKVRDFINSADVSPSGVQASPGSEVWNASPVSGSSVDLGFEWTADARL